MWRSITSQLLFGWVASLLFSFHAHAASLNGAWATDVDACSKIFVKKNNRIAFADDADLYGSGIIINGNKLQGKLGTCHVISRKVQGANVHLSTSCATSVAVSSVEIILSSGGENNALTRLFPSMPDMEVRYVRCPH